VRQLYSRSLDGADRVSRWVIIAFSAAMIAIVSGQIVLRYGFNSSIDWSDEISRLLFVWTMFLAIPLGIREGAHVGIELLTAHIPGHVRSQLLKGCALVSAAMMAMVCWEAVRISILTWDEMMQSTNLSTNWFMVPVAIASAHSFFHLIQLLWREPVRTVRAVE
jgi:TRAP-type C4-dicarboxylate transport system permease small subunit